MVGGKKFVAGVMLSMPLSFSALAAEDTPLNAADRDAIVQTLVAKMNVNYIEPAVAERAGNAIARKNADGGDASAASAQAFSAALATDLREFSGDKHFGAGFYEGFRERSSTADLPSRAKMEEWRDQTARRGYDIQKIERLPGNVGYIELRGFHHGRVVSVGAPDIMPLLTRFFEVPPSCVPSLKKAQRAP